jgi:hypothetical protein
MIFALSNLVPFQIDAVLYGFRAGGICRLEYLEYRSTSQENSQKIE